MEIRKARVKEAQALIDLHMDTVKRVNSKDYSSEQIEVWLGKRKVEITERMIANGEYYVAVDEQDNLLGTGHMRDCVITGLYVSADHQRKGIGAALLARMESDAAGAGAVAMRIDSTVTAESFYRRMGYDVLERKKIGKALLEVAVMGKRLTRSSGDGV